MTASFRVGGLHLLDQLRNLIRAESHHRGGGLGIAIGLEGGGNRDLDGVRVHLVTLGS
jgi:hypothetical protein